MAWQDDLQPASWRGVGFGVDVAASTHGLAETPAITSIRCGRTIRSGSRTSASPRCLIASSAT